MIDFMMSLLCVVHFMFSDEILEGVGVMNLVSGSSSSSYMDCMVFFGGE